MLSQETAASTQFVSCDSMADTFTTSFTLLGIFGLITFVILCFTVFEQVKYGKAKWGR